MVLASFVHHTQYVIRYFRQSCPRITQLQGYGMLKPLHLANIHIINFSYMKEQFHGVDHDIGLVYSAIQQQHEVN